MRETYLIKYFNTPETNKTNNMKIKFSLYPKGSKLITKKDGSKYWAPNAKGRNFCMEFKTLVEELSTLANDEFLTSELALKGANGYIGGVLKEDNIIHSNDNIIENQVLMFDYDETYKVIFESHLKAIQEKNYNYLVFSSANNDASKDTVRMKMLIPLANSISPKEYKEACYSFIKELGVNIQDESDIEAIYNDSSFLTHSHIQFLPTISSKEWKENNWQINYNYNGINYKTEE